jgi:hypothetical protein
MLEGLGKISFNLFIGLGNLTGKTSHYSSIWSKVADRLRVLVVGLPKSLKAKQLRQRGRHTRRETDKKADRKRQ